jgi:hypothetical protein
VSGGGIHQRRPSGRKICFAFGNSIAAHSSISLISGAFSNSVAALSGATVVTVAGDQTATFTASSKVAIQLYSTEVFKTTVVSSVFGTATQITLAAPLPKYVRASASATIAKYTTAAPTGITRDIGEINAATALLGGDIDVVQGYSHGGNLSSDGMQDFAKWVKVIQPDYVWLRLFDNDIPAQISLARMKEIATYYAKVALASGAIPLFGTPVPNSSCNTAPKCALWDGMRDWLLTINTVVPGAIGINTSQWLDPANISTSRAPLATVASDGIHSDASARYYIGNLIAPQLPSGFVNGDYAYLRYGAISANAAVTGTAGTNFGSSGAATPTGSVADSWTAEAAGATTTLVNSKNADGSQKVVFAVAGTGNFSSTVAYFRQTVSPSATGPQFGSFGGLKPVFKIRVNSLSGMSCFVAQIIYSGGETYASQAGGYFDTTNFTTIVGKTVVIEGPAVACPDGATNFQLRLMFRPLTGSTNPSCDIDIIEGMAIPDVEQPLV